VGDARLHRVAEERGGGPCIDRNGDIYRCGCGVARWGYSSETQPLVNGWWEGAILGSEE
jgi:hypothetical protein